MISDSWLPAPEHPLLDAQDIHVWRADLNQVPSIVQALSQTLTPDERQRAGKYHFQKDRDHFIVARGVLREILSRYLNISPDQIRFSYSQYGKPALDAETSDYPLRFNVSHSHGVALYTLTREREVGIDIEFMREDFASLEIAERFFSPVEVQMLRALPLGMQTAGFFNCWTRKEAYIKALGEGLSHPLHQFAVSLSPGEPAALLSTDNNLQEASRWSLVGLSPGPGYVAAIAVEGHASALKCWQWLSGSKSS